MAETPPVSGAAHPTGTTAAEPSPRPVEEYSISPRDLARPVEPSSLQLQHAKEGNAFRLARGLIVGLGVIVVLIFVMIGLNTYPNYREDSVATWMEILGHVKEVSLFVLGAMAGYWFSK